MPPAARVADPVAHPLPGVLGVGPGSTDVIIGYMPAWRGVPAAVADALKAAKDASDQAIAAAEKATQPASGTPGYAAAKAAEETVKATAATTMGSMISSSAGGADIHTCAVPLPIPPHGPGVVIDGSSTVLINKLPACRQGDTVLEAVGPPDKITKGEPTVVIGDQGGGGGGGAGGAGGGAATTAAPADTSVIGAPPGATDTASGAIAAVSIAAATVACECSNPDCTGAFSEAAEQGTPLVDREADGCAPSEPEEATGNPNAESTESKTHSNAVKLVFEPDKSKEVKQCEVIGQVQVIQMIADGTPLKPGDYYTGFKYRDVAALSNGTYVDHSEKHTSPDYQSKWAGSHGKKNGGLADSVLHDAPQTGGGDKKFYNASTNKNGWKKVVYRFEVFAWCRKGKDCPKFYGPGVKWEYVKTWEDLRDGKKGTTKITDQNVKTPSSDFLAAYKKFNKVKKYTPCKEK